MALPTQLKTARQSNSTLISQNAVNLAALELAASDLLAIPLDSAQGVPVSGAQYSQITDSTLLPGFDATERAFDRTYTLPSGALRVGTTVRVSACGVWGGGSSGSPRLHVRIGGLEMMRFIQLVGPAAGRVWFFKGAALVTRLLDANTAVLYSVDGWGQDGNGNNLFPGEIFCTAAINSANVIDISQSWATAGTGLGNTLKQFIVEVLQSGGTT